MKLALLFPLALILYSSPAYAYLDPGVGSMLLQALAAAAIGVSLFWKGLVHKIRQLIFRDKVSDAEPRAADKDKQNTFQG